MDHSSVRAWLEAMGKTEADLEPSATPFVVSFFAALLTALVLALLLAPMGEWLARWRSTGLMGGSWFYCDRNGV